MTKTRLEAFSDGVLAIIITIMVLEFKLPDSGPDHTLTFREVYHHVKPVFLAYVLSFVFVGIYWGNHHHLLHAVKRVSGAIMWANLHLLFWLSLIPFTTHWIAHGDRLDPAATAAYGLVLMLAGFAYRILVSAILASHGPDSELARAIGSDLKGWVSVVLYACAIPIALFVNPKISIGLYVLVAAIWIVPDKRIERQMAERA